MIGLGLFLLVTVIYSFVTLEKARSAKMNEAWNAPNYDISPCQRGKWQIRKKQWAYMGNYFMLSMPAIYDTYEEALKDAEHMGIKIGE